MGGSDCSGIVYVWNGVNACTNEIGYNRMKNRNWVVFCQLYFPPYRKNGNISNTGIGAIDSNCDCSTWEHA